MESPEGQPPSDLVEPSQLTTGDAAIDEMFEQGLAALQEGRWRDAAQSLEEVLRQRPDHADAQALLEEVRLKASLQPQKPRARFRLPRLPVRPALLIVGSLAVIVVAVTGLRELYRRVVLPSQLLQQTEQRRNELLARAVTQLADQDYIAAEAAFLELQKEFPDSVEAPDGIARARQRMALGEDYESAREAIAGQEWIQAQGILESIAATDPSYRDVEELLVFVQERQKVEDAFVAAEEAFSGGQWLDSIAKYRTLMALDAHYQSSLVTQRLFDSYLYQGRALVQNTKGEGDAVQEAIDWYLTALTLQPQHQRALYEIALAQRYLEGRRLLAQPKRPQEQGKNEDNSLSQAVALLQWVYQQEPDYAGGTVAAILKAATEAEHPAEPQISGDIVVPAEDETSFEEQRRLHLQQADEAMAAENYTLAVEHYQQAADVAIHGGYDSAKWLFAAYVKIGTAYTAQHEDELAILAFQTAIAVMQASGTAIPEEDYAPYVQEGDLLAQDLDFAAALEPYAQALQVMSAKCDCGLEEWSILR